MKRITDLVASAIAIGVMLPLLPVMAFLILMDSPGPVFYLAERVGRRGQLFTMYKLRTMFHNVPGPGLSYFGDPRVTRLGRILRRTKMDELPQLVNVVKGDMSLVGPRPEAPRFFAGLPPDQRKILDMAPGITGLAQLKFRDESDAPPTASVDGMESEYCRDILPLKLSIDMEYMRRRSLLLDGGILAQTLRAVLFSRGAE
ncbi:MAG: sugar transferase [Chloroflexi bacterium]|nr:sugar transferase [Chloroflexota bacterium]